MRSLVVLCYCRRWIACCWMELSLTRILQTRELTTSLFVSGSVCLVGDALLVFPLDQTAMSQRAWRQYQVRPCSRRGPSRICLAVTTVHCRAELVKARFQLSAVSSVMLGALGCLTNLVECAYLGRASRPSNLLTLRPCCCTGWRYRRLPGRVRQMVRLASILCSFRVPNRKECPLSQYQ